MAAKKKKGKAKATSATPTVAYALEQLFDEQEKDFVIDCIATVLAWVPGKGTAAGLRVGLTLTPASCPRDNLQFTGRR